MKKFLVLAGLGVAGFLVYKWMKKPKPTAVEKSAGTIAPTPVLLNDPSFSAAGLAAKALGSFSSSFDKGPH